MSFKKILKEKRPRRILQRLSRRMNSSTDRFIYMRQLTKEGNESHPLLLPRLKRFDRLTLEFEALYQTFTEDRSFIGRFDGKVICHIAFVEDEPAALLWTSLETCKEPAINAVLQLPPKVAYIMELYTKPLHQRKGLATFLLYTLCKELYLQGYERVFLLTQTKNRAMSQLAEKMGYVRYYCISTRWLMFLNRLNVVPSIPEHSGGILVRPADSGFRVFYRPRWYLTLAQPNSARTD